MSDKRLTERIRPDGTVEGHLVETYYRPCIGVGVGDGYITVLIDDGGCDIETRVLAETLNKAGWIRQVTSQAPKIPMPGPPSDNADKP